MTHPIRIQRKRTKGWRGHMAAPNGLPISYVHRPLKWGNPFTFKPGDAAGQTESVRKFEAALLAGDLDFTCDEVRQELRGKNLGCFCALDQPCHADVLLRIANEDQS